MHGQQNIKKKLRLVFLKLGIFDTFEHECETVNIIIVGDVILGKMVHG